MSRKILWAIIFLLSPDIAKCQDIGTDLQYTTDTSIYTFSYERELDNIARSVSIIGLGEATHATLEFEAVKCEVTKLLITKYNYRHFILEASVAHCNAINSYITGGNGKVTRVLKMYCPWPWYTKGMIDLIEWIREYNKNKPVRQQVKFYGMDIQYRNAINLMLSEAPYKTGFIYGIDTNLIKDLGALNTNTEKEIRPKLDVLLKKYASFHYDTPFDSFATMNTIESMYINIEPKKGKLMEMREKALYNNVMFILNHIEDSSKVILWGHNGHIEKSSTHRKSLGNYLADSHSKKYAAIGFEFNKGSFRARSLSENGKYENRVYSIEENKYALGTILASHNSGIIGINTEKNKNHSLIRRKQYLHHIGAEYNLKSAKDETFYLEKITPLSSFNYIFIINDTKPTIPAQ